MSGIYGILSPTSSVNKDAGLRYMEKWNLAYGSDSYSPQMISLSSIEMGICQSKITVSPESKSSIISIGKHTAVIDATIYNRNELIDKYSLPDSLSDEELLANIISMNGFDSLSLVNGDFAGAVWDGEKETLTLFRDHLGIRPLFYYMSPSFTCFSSDIRGLIAVDEVPADINPQWIYKFVCGYDTADFTATEVNNVFQVKPASYIVISFSNGNLSYDIHDYWLLGTKKVHYFSKQKYVDKLRELITDSVKRRLDIFPGLIGAELSGGLDSGVIDILINRLGRQGVFYSWSRSPEILPLVPNDERSVIADICRQENIDCYYGTDTIDMGPSSNIWKSHVKAGLSPSSESDPRRYLALPLYIDTLVMSETAQLMKEKGASVIFSGHGGDEGVSHRCAPFELFYNKEYLHCFRELMVRHQNRKCPPYGAVKSFIKYISKKKEYDNTPFQDSYGAPQIINKDFAKQFDNNSMPILTFAFDTVRYSYSGNTHFRPDVAALIGAYSGAQYVFPFLDYRVIDYAVSIPRHLYLYKNQNRHIYRQAFKDIMPNSLYICTDKDNPSEKNLPKTQDNNDWYSAWEPQKKLLIDSLDWDYWGRYIDKNEIDKWDKSGKPSAEETEMYFNVVNKLRECALFQSNRETIKKNNL